MRRIRVAVVDDSTFVRKAIVRMLRDETALEVVGTAESGEELLANLGAWQPDVITLDLSMPGMGGLLTLDRIMAVRPTPVIILSTHAGDGAPQTIEALHRGAVDFIDKQSYSLMDFEAMRAVLLEKLLQVSSDSPEKRGPPDPSPPPRQQATPQVQTSPPEPARPQEEVASSPGTSPFDILLIGASTGGPPVIETILAELGPNLGIPVAIVQHMPHAFTTAFADRLNANLTLQVREATDNETLLAGTAYIAPAGLHLRVQKGDNGRLFCDLTQSPEDASHRPSVDVLFNSAAEQVGNRSLGILLTGMGRDGARGMSDLAQSGGYTIVQDRESSVVYGMPRAAVALNAARETLPAHRIAERVRDLLRGV